MKRNLIIALVVIIVALILLSIFIGVRVIPVSAFVLFGLVAWIFMMRKVRAKKTDIFPEQIGIKSAEKRLKVLNILLVIGGVTFLIGLAGVIAHNTLYAVNETEDAVTFILGIFGIGIFVITTFNSLLIFILLRRKFVS